MRVEPEPGEGELGHVGAADDDRACGDEALHHRRIGLGRRRVVERDAAGHGDVAGDIEQILDRDRQALKG